MRSSVLLLLLLCTASLSAQEIREQGNLVFDGIPEVPTELVERLNQYTQVRSAQLLDWDPVRGGLYVATRFGNTRQLHHVAEPGAARYQLTFFSEPLAGGTVRPDAKRRGMIVSRDSGGGEAYQLFYLDLDSGRLRLLTDGKSRYGTARWSPDGSKMAFYGTERNGKDWDIYVMDPDKPEGRRRLTQESGAWFVQGWSQDGAELLVENYRSITDSVLYRLSVANGKLTKVAGGDGQTSIGAGLLCADGVFFTSDKDSEFRRLRYLSGDSERLVTADIDWNIDEIELSPDGKTLAFTANIDGLSHLYQLDTTTLKKKRLPTPQGLIGGLRFSGDGRHLAFTLDAGKAPDDVYSLELESLQTQRWTSSEVGGLDPGGFVAPELVRFKSFDGLPISAFYFRPSGPGPHPVVVRIHGGPESQYRPRFSSFTQFMVRELGLAVIAPNVRGSAGYGKNFLKLDNGFKREDSVKDIGALLDWIATREELRADRVAVYGGSYGGYMVLASMTHFPDRLVAGVDVVGISNFVTFLKNTKDYRRDLRRAEYGDERDPEMRAFQEKISPTNNAQKIKDPLLVIQGKNDPRVPLGEAEQMVAKVRSLGGEVWYLMAKDEGHGFRKKVNRDAYMQTLMMFLSRHLAPGR